ncbi:hypothetical protein [Pseudomarimonas arenosa]|uniref:Cytochrome c domain-containing protein n=1 Tax=Pseudomarimonas arenosa TaxID=2774145 RepID=A0AAW3ZJ40_9GAMM|nr:hypothetical protein [Pseudomarimonas arenosa]MBD8524471.1 hypothetical protein [Pseudomarimonas arenosa]
MRATEHRLKTAHPGVRCAVVSWLLLAAPLSAWAASGCDDLGGQPIHPNVDWEMDVKPILNNMLGGRCSGCHNGAIPPDMTDNGVDAIFKLVNFYVTPGRPQESQLFIKVNCDVPDSGGRMPLAGANLSTLQQELLYDWIAQGARGESPPGAISRDFIFRDGGESLRESPAESD